MKNIIIIVAVMLGAICTQTLFTSFTSSADEAVEEGIRFHQGTWDEAKALAKKENKLIFLDAYASWCGPCKLLKRRVFPDETLGNFFNDNFINVAMDMERGVGPQLARKYRLNAYPTLYFIDADGSLVHTSVGYHDVAALLEIGKSVAARQ